MKNLFLLYCTLLSIYTAQAQGKFELKANVLPLLLSSQAELSGEYLLGERIGIEAGGGYYWSDSQSGYQIRGHYDNLAVHIGAFNVSTDISQMYFITTADTGVSFDVFEYGNSYQTINTEHIWGYYKMNDNGQMEINFALWNDWSPVHWITGPLFLKTNLPVVVDSRYCTYCTRP